MMHGTHNVKLIDKHSCFGEGCFVCFPDDGECKLPRNADNHLIIYARSYPKELNLHVVNWRRMQEAFWNSNAYLPAYTASYPRISESFYYWSKRLKFHITGFFTGFIVTTKIRFYFFSPHLVATFIVWTFQQLRFVSSTGVGGWG